MWGSAPCSTLETQTWQVSNCDFSFAKAEKEGEWEILHVFFASSLLQPRSDILFLLTLYKTRPSQMALPNCNEAGEFWKANVMYLPYHHILIHSGIFQWHFLEYKSHKNSEFCLFCH